MYILHLFSFHFLVATLPHLSQGSLVFLQPPGVPQILDTNSSSLWSNFSNHASPQLRYMSSSLGADPSGVMPEQRHSEVFFLGNNELFRSLVSFHGNILIVLLTISATLRQRYRRVPRR
jgi:hypothetical protein